MFFELKAKRKGISQDKLNQAQEAAFDRLDKQDTKGLQEHGRASTGRYGKMYEPAVRHQLSARGLESYDYKARPNDGRYDGKLFYNGHYLKYEIKTGDGIVGDMMPTDQPSWTEDDILPKADIVIYCAEPSLLEDEDDLLDNSVALYRAEFLEFIAVNGPKRSQSVRTATKAGTNDAYWRAVNCDRKKNGEKPVRDCICLQSAYRAARWNACISGEYRSLRTLLEELGRA